MTGGAPAAVPRMLFVLLAAMACPAAVAAQATSDLKRMGIEDLLGVEVTTFSRGPRAARDVPAALHVITRDDIRRSGATTLIEAIRLAPGVLVARQDSARYAVGVRGNPDRLSRAILVMIDGRPVYSPLFAGTYWEVQDTLLEDVERIEVIRGPGGTLWGANAVNGIINVITKPARETTGTVVRGGAGSAGAGPFAVRVGSRFGDHGHARVYAKARTERPQYRPTGPAFDSWHLVQSGARADWTLAGDRALTLQGDVYAARLGQLETSLVAAPPYSRSQPRRSPLSGGNVLARWSGAFAAGGEFQLMAYYDRASRDERPVAEDRDTVSVDFQHRLRRSARHDLTWGVGYRASHGRIEAQPPTAFDPASRLEQVPSLFAEDDIVLVPKRLRLIAGARVEHNRDTGIEIQPRARLLWTTGPASSLVASVSRAVRTPSRVETEYTTMSVADPSVPSFVRLLPNGGFVSEKVIAYELGYRRQAAARLHTTVAAFFNQLDDVLSTERLPTFVEDVPPPARLIVPVTFRNGLHGNSHGLEATADWRPAAWLRGTGSYSFVRTQLTKDPGSTDVSQERRGEGLMPRHQGQLGISIDLPRSLQVDATWRRVSALPAGPIPAYSTMDARLGWIARRGFELAVVGRNLQQSLHAEWPGSATRIRRSVAVSATLRR